VSDALTIASEIGYPLIIKAAFGGGGRGMRRVNNESELGAALNLAMGEAQAGFGRSEVFIEKLLTAARHIEVQVLGDGNGSCVHLGTRDCSVQRRYQKLIEESPASSVSKVDLENLADKCAAAMASLSYRNAATIEFLFENGEFYFLEVNTRLQVEHPVTEMVTGIDLVASQLTVADTNLLPFDQSSVTISGHAIECRILAEDALGQPSPGLISGLRLPGGPGVRLDSHIYVGYRVPHQYDSLIAKLVVHGENRPMALARMKLALNELQIDGIVTNLERLKRLTEDLNFVNDLMNTNWNPE
jgi:acetyl-CoA carboxylase biotin carboxylase subunit